MPMDMHEAELFVNLHWNRTFWCGTNLGGCGKKLSPKVYGDRVCHFAHYPPVNCRRSRLHTGTSDADHLFIAYELMRWLQYQQFHDYRIPEFEWTATGRCSSVTLRRVQKNGWIHVPLRSLPWTEWQNINEYISEGSGVGNWCFGPTARAPQQLLDSGGYVFRVKCEPSNGSRAVKIGTAVAGFPVVWEDLEQCRMTKHGISTPMLEAFGGPNTHSPGAAEDKQEPRQRHSAPELHPTLAQKQATERAQKPQIAVETPSGNRSLLGPHRFQLIEQLPGVSSTPDGFPKHGYRVEIFHDDGSKESARLLLDIKIHPYQPTAIYETRVTMVSSRPTANSNTIYAHGARITDIDPKRYSDTKWHGAQPRVSIIDQIIRDLPLARLSYDDQRLQELMAEGERLLPHLSGKQARAMREILYGKSEAS